MTTPALAASNDLIATLLLKHLPAYIYWKNQEGSYLGCNDAFAELHGLCSPQEIIGKTDHALYPEEIATALILNDKETIKQKKTSLCEETLKTPYQREMSVLTYKIPVFEKKRLTLILSISFDIAHLIKPKRDELNYILENIISILPEHVYWKDVNGIIRGCNDQQARSVGLKSHLDMIGKTPYDTLPKDQADIVHAMDMEVIKTGIAKTIVEKSSKHDGTIAIYESRKVPLFDAKKKEVTGLVGISIDITERVEAEEREKEAIRVAAEERANAKAEAELRSAVTILAGSIAHDLRTPLGSMSIIIDLFTKFWLNFMREHEQFIVPQNSETMRMHLEKIDSFPVKMKKLISEMDTFIRVTLKSMQHLVAGTLSYEDFTVCYIETCMDDAISIYPFKNGEKELINIHIEHNFSFLGYPVLFYRVIFNLIRNSLEQIEKNKKGQIFITAKQDEKCNIVSFKDTAGGAPADIVAHLFDGYITTKEKGTGVGLAFCKLTMQSFDGDITCYSVEGDYIEFTLSFPFLHGESVS